MALILEKKKGLISLAIAAVVALCGSLPVFAQTDIPNDLLNDELPLQILIEVLIADIAHDNDFELGVQHEFIDSGKSNVSLFNDRSRTGSGNQFVTRSQTGDFGSGIIRFPLTDKSTELYQGLDLFARVLDVDAGQLYSTIQALSEAGKGEILSRPSIVSINGQTALIKTGQRVPYLERKVTAQKEIFVSAGTDTGITLEVTPTVEQSDEGVYFVKMQVKPEVSFVSRNREERGILLPVKASRHANTTVLVASGRTFILGGLFRDNVSKIKRGVPGLSKIPLIGAAFSSTSRSKLRSELIISITPTVLDPGAASHRRGGIFRPAEKEIPETMKMELLPGWGEIQRRSGTVNGTSKLPVEATGELSGIHTAPGAK